MIGPSGPRVVKVAEASGWNVAPFAGWLGLGPRWSFRCGACWRPWRDRIPMMSRPSVVCPHCGATNLVPIEVGR